MPQRHRLIVGMARPRRSANDCPNSRLLRVETLEDRRMLANVTVSNLNDVVNGTVTSIAALVANSGGDGISLREAVLAANADNMDAADVIDFGALTGTIQLIAVDHAGEIVISSNLTINGPGADVLGVQAFAGTAAAGDGAQNLQHRRRHGEHGPQRRHQRPDAFRRRRRRRRRGDFRAGEPHRCREHPHGQLDAQFSARGAAAASTAPASFTTTFPNSLSVFHCLITGNAASRGDGGGIRKRTGTLVIEASTISDNLSITGGGVSVADNVTSAQFDASVFSNNVSTGTAFGGRDFYL